MTTKGKILAACAIIMPAALPVSAVAQEAAGETVADSGEIIVTASKREERLQDVPGAIDAIGGETIDNLGVRSFRDYASLVPGLSQRDSGQPGVGTIILRGLNSGPQQTTNTAAFYIDDAPFSLSGYLSQSALTTPSPELAEIERIEVLKGPQGTLYGAGSLGGLIRIITKKPDPNRFYGNVRGEVSHVESGEEGFLIRGSVNIPIVEDVAAVSATGFYRREPGFVDNVGTGTRDVNRSNLAGGRLALMFRPTPELTINLSGLYQDIENFGAASLATRPGTFIPRFGGYSYSAFRDFGGEVKYRVATGSIDYETSAGTLTAVASYAKYNVNYSSDASVQYIAAGRTFLNGIVAGSGGLTRSQFFFNQPTDVILPANTLAEGYFSPNAEKVSAEVRFTSKRLGPIEFMAGAFYTDEDSVYYANIIPFTAANVPFAAPFNQLIRTTTTSKYKEIAGFGNLTFYLTDKLDVTGGIRYAENDQLSGTGGPGALTYFTPRAPLTFPIKESATTYLATVRWRPTSDLSFYARAASGYRPGGPQTNPTPPAGAQTIIRSDTVWNYEAGVKGRALDGALSFDVSVYHIDWNDIQLNTLANGIVLGGNAAAATVDGFELELMMRPSELLSVGINAGHTDAKIKDISAGAAAVSGARAGDKLPLTPAWTVALIADHQLPLSSDALGNIGFTLRHQSEAPATYPVLDPTPTQTLPEITTLDLRASVTFAERYTVQARVDNALNKFSFTNIDPAGNAVALRPRTFTLGVSVDF